MSFDKLGDYNILISLSTQVGSLFDVYRLHVKEVLLPFEGLTKVISSKIAK